jgi:hypothetical protein
VARRVQLGPLLKVEQETEGDCDYGGSEGDGRHRVVEPFDVHLMLTVRIIQVNIVPTLEAATLSIFVI